MSRPRALLALLLACTWCSAAWHVELDAAGLVLSHQHQSASNGAHGDHDHPSLPLGEHDPLFMRDVAKDGQLRLGAAAGLPLAMAAVFERAAGARPASWREPIPITGRTAPPLRKVWQFVLRCAPESAAPPALG